MVKIFLDTADIDEIREAASWGVLDGVTTNPTLVAKTGRKWSEVIQDILALVDGPISLEVTTTQADDMIKQGRQLAKLHQNVVVKIQMTTEGLKAIKALSSEGVRINTTLIFSSNQAILAAKAGAKYVSPFIGRLDDMGQEGMQVIGEIDAVRGTLHVANAVWRGDVAGPVRRARVRRVRDREGRRRRSEDPGNDALGESCEAARRSRLVSGPERDDCHRRRREDPRLHQRIQHHRGDPDRQPRDRRRSMIADRRRPIPVAELLPRDRGRRNRRDDRGMVDSNFGGSERRCEDATQNPGREMALVTVCRSTRRPCLQRPGSRRPCGRAA